MKRILLALSIFLTVCSCVQAQVTTARVWTLEECIQYAIEHNIDIKQRELQKQNAEIDVNTSKMSRLPNLNAGVGQNWSFGRSTDTESGLNENTTLSSTSLNVSSSTPLFTGFRINNEIAKSKLDLEAATQNLVKAKEDLSLSIASLFLQALFNKELLKVSEEQLALSAMQVSRTKVLVEVGKVPSSQLFDIEAQVAKDEVSVIQAKNNLQLSLLDLAQSLELERATSFDIQSPVIENVVEEYMSSVQPPQLIYDNAVSIKPLVKEQELRLESTKKALKIAQSGFYPTLSLSLGYGTGYYYNYDMKGVINPNTGLPAIRPFADQFSNNAGQNIGLSLSIPIFNRFQVRNQVRSARLNIQNQQLVLEDTKKNLYKEIQTAYLNATAAQEKYRASGRAVVASAESFKYANERYEIGKSTVFEFNESKTKLIQSQSEQIQAKYDYIFRTKILDFYNGIPIKL